AAAAAPELEQLHLEQETRQNKETNAQNVVPRLLSKAIKHTLPTIAADAAYFSVSSSSAVSSPAAASSDSAAAAIIPQHNGLPAFLHTSQLQRASVQRIHRHSSAQLHSSCDDRYHRTRLTACSVPHAAKWMTVQPTEPEFRMDDESFRLATRHRLGICPCDI